MVEKAVNPHSDVSALSPGHKLARRCALILLLLLLLLFPALSYAQEREGRVRKVIDGDTIMMDTGEKIRYIGIDAPESDQYFYKEAKRRNAELLSGKVVRFVVCEKTPMDKYGRTLAWVYVDNVSVSEALVKEGYARKLIISPCADAFDAHLTRYEKEANDKGLGIWSKAAVKRSNLPAVAVSEAAASVGKHVRVTGRVADVRERGKIIIITFRGEKACGFRAVVFKDTLGEFKMSHLDPMKLKGRDVAVSGAVRKYKCRTEIVLRSPEQLEVL